MTIKQQGGIFGRNPTFNNVEVEGSLTVNGESISDFGTMAQQDADNVNIDGGAIDGVTLGTNSKVTYTTLQGDANRVNIDSAATAYLRLNAWSGSQDADARIVADRNLGSGSQSVLDFQVNNGTSFFTHSRCETNGSFKIYTGNLVIGTSGKGIDFSATSGTGTSELFDDYEEGTWTPVPSSFINYTPTVQVGRYTKIGNLVTASFNMSWTSVNAGSNQFVVGGLPFTSSSATSYASAAAIGGSDYLTASVQVFAHVQDNTTSIKFFTMNSGSTKSNLLCSSWNASGSTNNIVGTVSYIV